MAEGSAEGTNGIRWGPTGKAAAIVMELPWAHKVREEDERIELDPLRWMALPHLAMCRPLGTVMRETVFLAGVRLEITSQAKKLAVVLRL